MFIDEIHTLVGAGAAEGAIDAASILKPMLARGELQTIGATTLDEYRKYLEKDAALERRFQPIQVAEPTIAHTIEILKGLRDRYEAHHRVSITDGALVAAAQLADRYISDRFLPDKAIDLIDEAGSRMRIRRMTAPPDLREYDEKIAQVRKEKESAIDSQDFEKAAALRDTEKQLLAKKATREKEWKAGDMDVVAEVNEELIAEVLATATGIPVFKLTEEESQRLLRMEDELHQPRHRPERRDQGAVAGHPPHACGLKDPKRPGGSFIFAGPSGVGKTELSKTLAEFLFGDEDSLIQLDMSEYMEKHTVSRLFGSPPGYVGYEEGGQLTEKVRRRPFSVVLFDEIEKAHPDIFNSLLQILEDGRLTDAQGRMVDFKNTVIIMTTNLGTRDISKGVSVGFARTGESRGYYDGMKAKVGEELKQHFRPEFLNRVDDIIVFHQLAQEEIFSIVDLMIAKVDDRLQGPRHGHRAAGGRQGAALQARLRPGARRAAAAPHDPAGDRGRPVREDPVRRAAAGHDRDRRRRGRGRRGEVHLHRRAEARVRPGGGPRGRRGVERAVPRAVAARRCAPARVPAPRRRSANREEPGEAEPTIGQRVHGPVGYQAVERAGPPPRVWPGHGQVLARYRDRRLPQHRQQPPPALPVGPLISLPGPFPGGDGRLSGLEPGALSGNRALAAPGTCRRAGEGAEFHHRDGPPGGDPRVLREEVGGEAVLRLRWCRTANCWPPGKPGQHSPTLVSSTACRPPNANTATAAAVYAPMPGNARRLSWSLGMMPECRSATMREVSCNRSARRG